MILKCHNDDKPKTDTIKKVASLAAYHSKQKKGGKVKVIYTYAKNVKKYRGAAPGSVITNKEKAVQVRPLSLDELGVS